MFKNIKKGSMGKKKSNKKFERSRLSYGTTSSFSKTLGESIDRKVAAPAAIGRELRNSYFRFDGRAQALSDYTGMGDSARVCGVDLFGTPITAGSTTAAAAFGGTATYSANMTPATISPRLSALESLFEYYAIRKLRITYVPTVGSNTAGSVAIGISQNVDASTTGTTLDTQREILELTPSMLTPVWQDDSCTYTHTGTKVWATSSQGVSSTFNSYIQGLFFGVLLGATTSVNYGQLRLEFVIDFYKPCPVMPLPSIRMLQPVPLDLSDQKDVKSAPIPKGSGSHAANLDSKPMSSYSEDYDIVDMPMKSPVLRRETKCGK